MSDRRFALASYKEGNVARAVPCIRASRACMQR